MKCFKYNFKNNKMCKKNSCRYWLKHPQLSNCCLNISNDKTMTLQEIGDIFKITRMRICQIEKNAIDKIKSKIKVSFKF